MEFRSEDIDDLARGAALLGTGGGGDPYIGSLILKQAMADGRSVKIIDADELDDDALVVPLASVGAPTVAIEKLPNGNEGDLSLRRLETVLGRKAAAVMPAEIGGFNSLAPLVVAARLGLPVVNADGMGRAFPQLPMVTFHVFGLSVCPATIANEHGEVMVIETDDNQRAERIVRSLVTAMGGFVAMALYPMTGAQVKRVAVHDTLALAIGAGRTIREAREAHRDPFESLLAYLGATEYYKHAKVIFDGKIVDLIRETKGGFAIGRAVIDGIGDHGGRMEVIFQNENLIARLDGKTMAIVPDLVCLLDRETAEPITTEGLKYGQRLKVLISSVPPIMRCPEALAVFGPRAFGFDEDFVPVEDIQ